MLQKSTASLADSSSLLQALSNVSPGPIPQCGDRITGRQPERRFHRTVENVCDYAMLTLDIKGCVISSSEGVLRIKGYTQSEIFGKSFTCFYPAEDIVAGRPAQVLNTAQTNGYFQEHGWRIRKDGSRFWADVLILAVRNGGGQTVGYSKIVCDLTEQRDNEQALARSNRLLEAIVDASPYSIITCDTQGLITSTNPAAERMLCYARDELLGKAMTEQLHDRRELIERAAQSSDKYGEVIEPGFDTFTHESRTGLVEKHEWTYIRKDGSRFPVHLEVTALRDDFGEITGFAGIAYDISERRRRDEYTQHLAHHDELTGLPNRTLLHERLNVSLARALREKTLLGLLMVDLDHFKRINDSLGHHVGDQLLKVVSERIVAVVRNTDTVARMGGDEFVVLLADLADGAAAENVAAKIVKQVALPIVIGEHELSVTASVGICCYPGDGDAALSLLKNADAAMYKAKSAGRNGLRRFSPEFERLAVSRLAMEVALNKALREQKLQVHYQPQFCLQTGHIVGMEALLRWQDAHLGDIPPKLFIPIAEESGLIVHLGEWVLGVACRDAMVLQKLAGRPLRMSVNVSARQLCSGSLLRTLQMTLDKSGFDPKLLELEITESMLIENHKESLACLHTLHALGVSLMLDDFGTGFSSLSYLTQLPISGLKIDQSFVEKMMQSKRDGAVVYAIIAMARGLGIKVIAEGVETAEQLLFLQQRFCDSVQGRLLGPAAPLEQFSAQGFRFSKALSMTQLCQDFEQLRISSEYMICSSLNVSQQGAHPIH